jgi:hypothetical protein
VRPMLRAVTSTLSTVKSTPYISSPHSGPWLQATWKPAHASQRTHAPQRVHACMLYYISAWVQNVVYTPIHNVLQKYTIRAKSAFFVRR